MCWYYVIYVTLKSTHALYLRIFLSLAPCFSSPYTPPQHKWQGLQFSAAESERLIERAVFKSPDSGAEASCGMPNAGQLDNQTVN